MYAYAVEGIKNKSFKESFIMRKKQVVAIVMAAIFAMAFLAGCASSQQASGGNRTAGQMMAFAPDWYANPSKAEDNTLGLGMAEALRMGDASSRAETRARHSLTLQLNAYVRVMEREHRVIVGEGAGEIARSMWETVNIQLGRAVLNNARVVNRHVVPTGGGYTAFVQVALPKTAARASTQESLNQQNRQIQAARLEMNDATTAMNRAFAEMLDTVPVEQ
jgi:hypothetical protein